MGVYRINGGKKLSGRIKAESAKNAVLPILAAAILTDEEVVIKDCPKISDVLNMIHILCALGCRARFDGNHLVLDSSNLIGYRIPSVLSREIRSSIFMLGSVLARFKMACVSYPGGCDIGLRPIEMHLKGLRQLGVEIDEFGGEISCRAPKLHAGEIYLDFPSVGATENIVLASVFTKGRTVVHNAAREPEIVDLQNFLNAMGARVVGAGSDTICIEGVKKLHGAEYRPISDRIEIGTYLVAAAITGGEVEIFGCNRENISVLLHKLSDITCKIQSKNDIIYLKSGDRRNSFHIDTRPYPGFPTDLQAQMLALATVCYGTSTITENIFETRFKHVAELKKMGADILVKDRTAIVYGKPRLYGADVFAHDLRGGAALVLAGLAAEGETVVHDVRHIERGYYELDKKLRMLGGDILKKERSLLERNED